MVKYCDLAICDSVNIEKYIHDCYDGKGIKGRNPKTTFIAYGADLTLSKLTDDDRDRGVLCRLAEDQMPRALHLRNHFYTAGWTAR